MKKLGLGFLLGTLVYSSLWATQGPKIEEQVTAKAADELQFIGCRPSISECRYSCPSTSTYAWKLNSPLCEEDFYEKVACFCAPLN